MFLGYYKVENAVGNQADLICVLGRTGLTKASHPVGLIKQTLDVDENGDPVQEANRILSMCQAQDIIQIDTEIDTDIAAMSKGTLRQLRQFKIDNPDKRATLKISVERYSENHMFYLDWLNQWINIKESTPELIGKTYMLYKQHYGEVVSNIESSFELMV